MTPLAREFSNRDTLIHHVQSISPWAAVTPASPILGGTKAATTQLSAIKPLAYGKSRNFLNGAVTHLSPYIRHGLLSLNQVRNHALGKTTSGPEQIEKFIQELAWRDYWQRVYATHPQWIWEDVEPYKTGFAASDYADTLPADIISASTDSSAMNAFITELHDTGYLHNHARMYLAAYIVHWRRVKWQAGAKWMHHHLLDGDLASNNLSWQWVASTFSQKPYFFNLENLQTYAGMAVDCSAEHNAAFDASYETLERRLFPHKEPRR